MQALKAVKRNRGAGGIDRMTTEELEPHLQAHGWILKDKLVARRSEFVSMEGFSGGHRCTSI